tara:strand:+ start:735 stop:1166 length:432 start_codon:yes stop_codon:yes gene_type:complete
MAALATIQAFNENEGPIGRGKVRASNKLYQGAMLARHTDGYLVVFSTGLFFAGHCLETVDNSSGSSGDLWASYRRGTYYGTVPVFSSATIANIGDPVWASNDNHNSLTLTDPGTTLTTTDLVGYVHNIDDQGNVVVKFISRLN